MQRCSSDILTFPVNKFYTNGIYTMTGDSHTVNVRELYKCP